MGNKWSEDEISRFMDASIIPVRLSCIARSGWPLVLSLWFVYRDGRIYCATPRSAKLVAHLEAEGRCAFEVAADRPPYRGLRGQGLAAVRPELGGEILDALIERYLDGRASRLAQKLIANRENEVAIEIRPHRVMTWDYTQRMRGAVVGGTGSAPNAHATHPG